MRYLIDTNIFMFYISNHTLLNKDVLYILQDWENRIYISSDRMFEHHRKQNLNFIFNRR